MKCKEKLKLVLNVQNLAHFPISLGIFASSFAMLQIGDRVFCEARYTKLTHEQQRLCGSFGAQLIPGEVISVQKSNFTKNVEVRWICGETTSVCMRKLRKIALPDVLGEEADISSSSNDIFTTSQDFSVEIQAGKLPAISFLEIPNNGPDSGRFSFFLLHLGIVKASLKAHYYNWISFYYPMFLRKCLSNSIFAIEAEQSPTNDQCQVTGGDTASSSSSSSSPEPNIENITTITTLSSQNTRTLIVYLYI